MTEAIFGLLGVLVGSAITWGIEVWRARRSDADEARVAARLVADELALIENTRTEDEPRFREQRELALRQDAWLSHRVVLARELPDERWQAVREGYDALALPQGDARTEELVERRYSDALGALAPLMTTSQRYWWQRLGGDDPNR